MNKVLPTAILFIFSFWGLIAFSWAAPDQTQITPFYGRWEGEWEYRTGGNAKCFLTIDEKGILYEFPSTRSTTGYKKFIEWDKVNIRSTQDGKMKICFQNKSNQEISFWLSNSSGNELRGEYESAFYQERKAKLKRK